MKTLLALSTLLIAAFTLQAQSHHMQQLQNLQVRSIGPANMSGRITAIDVVTTDPNVMYVGAASGGVWKSENGGSRWQPIFDAQPTQNIGAVAVQQNNPSVVWVGTGEGNPRNSMNLGMGLFKSPNGGRSWKSMGLEATKTIHRILIDPTDGNTVYVGAMGDPFTPGPHRGLYRTQDGGNTFEQILYTNEQSGVADLVMDPSNPKKLLAAMYDHRRTPYSFVSGGPGSGLYMTLDGGDTWTQLGEEQGLPAGELGRIGLAIAPSDPNRIYAKVEATRNALYRSNDGGFTWQMVNDDPRYTNNRPFYFQDLAVSSDDPNLLYNIYQPLSVSYDGGQSFDPVPQIPADESKGVHADFHAFWMSPTDAEFYIIGGDGGIGITHDRGDSWYVPETLPVAQFYQVNVDEQRPYQIYGGMQDNGNWYGPGYVWRQGGIRTPYWQYIVGGDGFYISPDAEDPRFGYGTSQNGDLYRYDKIGGYYSSIMPPRPAGYPRLRFHWNAAFAQDPHNSEAVYYGSQYVHRSTDEGKTWQIISPDLTTNNAEQQQLDYGGLTPDASGAEFYNCLLSIAPSPLDEQVIWTGSDDGRIHLTRNGGDTWTSVEQNIPGMPKGAWVARIIASEHRPGTAWAVVNDYRRGDYAPYLFRTDDYGQSWTNQIRAEAPVYGYALSFIQDPVEPRLCFLGTENGLWVSFDEGATWEPFGQGFPAVSTMDLKIQRAESALIIGTFGRAVWVVDDLLSLRAMATMVRNPPQHTAAYQPVLALPVNAAVQVKGLFIRPTGTIWNGFHTIFQGHNRPFWHTPIPYYITDTLPNAEISGVVLNLEGDTLQTLSPVVWQPTPTGPALVPTPQAEFVPSPGLHYLNWRLDQTITRLPGAWVTSESRGIPVLPGQYEIVIRYGAYTDATYLTVLPDPRYPFDPAVDQALYQAQTELNSLRTDLVATLAALHDQRARVDTLRTALLKADPRGLLTPTERVLHTIDSLTYLAQGQPVTKQVGAYQSFQVTPMSTLRAAQQKFMSSHQLPSPQELALLAQARASVNQFLEQYAAYLTETWQPFVTNAGD